MKMRQWLSMFLLAAMLGCAAMPVPKTFEDRLALGLGTVIVVATTAQTLLQAEKISVGDAQNVLAAGEAAMAGIEIARQLASKSPDAAEAKLVSVMGALQTLSDYLAAKGKQP